MALGNTVTLRFKARWLRGYPVPLLRLNGNWFEATGVLPSITRLLEERDERFDPRVFGALARPADADAALAPRPLGVDGGGPLR